MIEIIYKNNNVEQKETTTLKLPKNIRQIGHGDSDYQIYIEDYLMNYLKKRPEREGDIRYGVLLGEVKIGNGYTYFFINGAVDVEEVLENTIIFNDDVWTGLYEDINNYFTGNRIVGWFAALNDTANNDMMNIKKLHLDNFAGMDKLFLKLDMDEDEESFYVYENTGLTKQPCYHIYFNKSEYMEDYIYGTGKKDKYKKPDVKNTDTGKYGILLNNINEKHAKEAIVNEKNEEVKEEEKAFVTDDVLSKFGKGMSLTKVAAFAVAVTIAASVGVMYRDGKLDNAKEGIVNFASGIMNSEDEKDLKNIISVNGIVETETTSEFVSEPASSGEAASETIQTAVVVEQVTTTESITAEALSTAIIEESTEPSTETLAGTDNIYVVQEGDTLLSICIDFYNDKSKLDEVIAVNNITNPDIVIPGEELIMP